MTGKGYGSIIPDVEGAGLDDLTRTLGHKICNHVDHYLKDMEKVIHSILTFIGLVMGV